MTKVEAVQKFKEVVLPLIKEQYEQCGQRDLLERQAAWDDFTDFLWRGEEITLQQYDIWTYPNVCKS